jgi:rubrerythrin
MKMDAGYIPADRCSAEHFHFGLKPFDLLKIGIKFQTSVRGSGQGVCTAKRKFWKWSAPPWIGPTSGVFSGKDNPLFSIKDIIDMAVQIERNGEKVYRDACSKMKDPALISLLNWLADEEAAHADWFRRLEKTVFKPIADPKLEKMGRDILVGMLGKQSFSLDTTDLTTAQNVKDLMAMAVEFEEDTMLFYEMLRPFVEDDHTKAQLDKIIEEEAEHIQKLLHYKYK